MYKLLINSSQRREKSVKLIKSHGSDRTTLGEISGDIDLVVSIKKLLSENSLKVADIDEVEPFLGPGSFTGLKLGVTVANVINWVNKKRSLWRSFF